MQVEEQNPRHPETSKRLRLLRLALGHKQAEIAYLVGVHANGWSNYEQGSRRPGIEEAIAIANVTGVSLDSIYRGLESALPSDLVKKLREAEEHEAERSSNGRSKRPPRGG